MLDTICYLGQKIDFSACEKLRPLCQWTGDTKPHHAPSEATQLNYFVESYPAVYNPYESYLQVQLIWSLKATVSLSQILERYLLHRWYSYTNNLLSIGFCPVLIPLNAKIMFPFTFHHSFCSKRSSQKYFESNYLNHSLVNAIRLYMALQLFVSSIGLVVY
jgi:hypothetical protein